MNARATAGPAPSLLQLFETLPPHLPQLDSAEFAAAVAPFMERLLQRLSPGEWGAISDPLLALCRSLYASARSGHALPLAQALLAQAALSGDRSLERRASSVCGLLAADAGDVVGAISYHSWALSLATQLDDRLEQGETWNNIGLAFQVGGNQEHAARSFRNSLALTRSAKGLLYSRFAANGNLAGSLYRMGEIDEGLRHAGEAIAEISPDFVDRDYHNVILIRRTLVRLLIAAARIPEAEAHAAEVTRLAERARTPRALIASATTTAALDLALGRFDLALTRLEDTLAQARAVPGTFWDTLACVIEAEERAGNAERALIRLQELSDHVFRHTIGRARGSVDLASLFGSPGARTEHRDAMARARLVSLVRPPEEPENWNALRRLAVAAALRIDGTGMHGVRVGALTRALALACGVPSLGALEIGMAAELHDIGLLSVPQSVLDHRSGGGLGEFERGLVARHAEAGTEILRDDRHPRMLHAREIVKYHHAHWDGSGRPEGVGGTAIPLAARMCAVANAYDSLVCGLEGQAASSMKDALAQLQREAGRKFDPDLVRRFETLIRGEAENYGIDTAAVAGLEGFQSVISLLQADEGNI